MCVNIHAPGDTILSAGIDSPTSEITRTGTSMAAPMIAGQALLIMAAAPELPISAVRDIIVSSGARGTLDSDVHLPASSIQIARVPWRKLDFRHSESVFVLSESEGAEKRPVDIHFGGDIVEIDLETTSITKPPMQFIGMGVARNITQKIQFALAGTEIDTDSISTECYRSPADASTSAATTSATSRIPVKMRCLIWSQAGAANTVAVQLAMLSTDSAVPLRTADDGIIKFAPQARVAQSSVKAADSPSEGTLSNTLGDNGIVWLIATSVVAGVALVVVVSVLIVRRRRN